MKKLILILCLLPVVAFSQQGLIINATSTFPKQITGLKSFTTLAFLQAYPTPDINDSYKVTNDNNTSLNGSYHWVSGATYIKDGSGLNGEVLVGSLEAVEGDKIHSFVLSNEIKKPTYGIKNGGDLIDISSLLTGFDIQADFYIEMVFTIESDTPDLTSILSTSNATNHYIRARFGNRLDCGFYNTSDVRTVIQYTVGNDAIHAIFKKAGTTMYLYINGVEVLNAEIAGTMKLADYYKLNTYVPISLFRIGQTSAIDATARYNNGLPFDVEVDDALIEFKTSGFASSYIFDNISSTAVSHAVPSIEVLNESPYPDEIIGIVPPNFVPQFDRQKYYDSVAEIEYVARGNTFAGDWKAVSTSQETDVKQDILISGTNIKTINNVSVLGAGNIIVGDGGVSVESREFENVTSYGAVGNGITDDTQAIENAIDTAALTGNYVYFPTGTYLIKRGLVLQTGTRLIGALNATIIKAPSITQLLQANVSIGDTFAIVQDASLYEIGQEIAVLTDETASGVGGNTTPTFGVIEAIDTGTDRIDFIPREGYTGAVANVTMGVRSYFTNDFSMITTNQTIRTTDNVIDGLILNKNAQSTDPIYYFFATIHTNQNSTRTTVENCTLLSSNSDGISLQGDRDMIYENNTILDVDKNAIHFGTTCQNILINNNRIERSARGVFWCFNNKKINVTKNHFIDCEVGAGAIDNQSNLGDRDSNISGNTFDNCTKWGIDISGGYRINIEKNFFVNFDNLSIPIYIRYGSRVIIGGNQFDDFASQFNSNVIYVDVGNDITIVNNIIVNALDVNSCIRVTNLSGVSNKVIIQANNIEGGANCISVTDLTNSIITANICEIRVAGTPISIVTPTNVTNVNNIEINP